MASYVCFFTIKPSVGAPAMEVIERDLRQIFKTEKVKIAPDRVEVASALAPFEADADLRKFLMEHRSIELSGGTQVPS